MPAASQPGQQSSLSAIIHARQELLERMTRLDALAATLEDIVRQAQGALIDLREELCCVVRQQPLSHELLPQLASMVAQTQVAAELSEMVIADCRQGMDHAKQVLAASEELVRELEAASGEHALLRPGMKQACSMVRDSILQGEALVLRTARSAEMFLDRSREIEVIRNKVRNRLRA